MDSLLELTQYWILDLAGLVNVATLIGCGIAELKLALSTRKMKVRNDIIVQKLTLSQGRITSSFVNERYRFAKLSVLFLNFRPLTQETP